MKNFSSPDELDLFLRGAGRASLLTREEETQLSEVFQAGRRAQKKLLQGLLSQEERRLLLEQQEAGAKARERFLLANLRLVVTLSRRYLWSSLSQMDLIQEGVIGLMKALEKFDPERGFKFSTYASWWINQSMARAIQVTGEGIRIPVYKIEQRNHLRQLQRTLPLRGEESLALAMGISITKLRELQELPYVGESLDEPLKHSEENSESLGVDFLEDENSERSEDLLYQKEISERLSELLSEIPERDRALLLGRYGPEDLSLQDLGEALTPELGLEAITRERVRQILMKRLRELRSLCLKQGLSSS